MEEGSGNLSVERSGDVIVARVRGRPTAAVILDCQNRVVTLMQDTGCRRVLYDAREMERPSVDVALTQQSLTEELKKLGARIAVVVPDPGIAFLGRLAFGEGEHRVFYDDVNAATAWLMEGKPQAV